jgi:hypothetical protein
MARRHGQAFVRIRARLGADSRRYAPAVNVKAWLAGHPFDLPTLTELFASGDTRVVKEGEDYAPTSTEIDNRPDGVPFYAVAPVVLQRVNGLARVLRGDDYRPVGLSGRYQEGDGNHTVASADVAEARGRRTRPRSSWVRRRWGCGRVCPPSAR